MSTLTDYLFGQDPKQETEVFFVFRCRKSQTYYEITTEI